MKIGVAVVVRKERHILIGKRLGSDGAGFWACPGGHLEENESPEECAARELFEETGLKALRLSRGGWAHFHIKDKPVITLFVKVESFEGALENREPHKCEGWEWHHIDSLPGPLFAPLAQLLT